MAPPRRHGAARASTNAALNGSVVVAESGSGHWSFTRNRNSERKRVSRKKRPCGNPGNMSPELSEIANAVPSTSVTTPPSPPSDGLELIVQGCGTGSHVTAGAFGLPWSQRDRPDPARKLRRCGSHRSRHRGSRCRPSDTAASSSSLHSSPTGSPTPVTTSRCSRPAGSQTKASLVSPFIDQPDPALLGNPLLDTFHAAAAYLDIVDHFDVVHDHSGIVGPALGALLRGQPPVVHTLHGPWTVPSRKLYGLLADHVHLVAISEAQRAANPDIRYAGVVHNGIDVDAYPLITDKDDFLVYIGRATPTRARRSRSRSPGAPGSHSR